VPDEKLQPVPFVEEDVHDPDFAADIFHGSYCTAQTTFFEAESHDGWPIEHSGQIKIKIKIMIKKDVLNPDLNRNLNLRYQCRVQ
jgi:hypothetical protein